MIRSGQSSGLVSRFEDSSSTCYRVAATGTTSKDSVSCILVHTLCEARFGAFRVVELRESRLAVATHPLRSRCTDLEVSTLDPGFAPATCTWRAVSHPAFFPESSGVLTSARDCDLLGDETRFRAATIHSRSIQEQARCNDFVYPAWTAC